MGSMCGFFWSSSLIPRYQIVHTYRYLLHLLLHGVNSSGGCGESLDGLRGENALVLYGHWLELR